MRFAGAAAAAVASVCTANTEFIATFPPDVFESSAWIKSGNADYATQDVGIEPSALEEFASDTGLLLRASHSKYGVGAMFDKPLTNEAQDLVVQYEVQLRNGLACGGAYIKLLRDEPGVSIEGMDNTTPYTIMFGPDKCGSTNKVHFILQHKSPVTGEWTEHHFKAAPRIKEDTQFHLYTLILKKDGAFEILIDGTRASSGALSDSMAPSINPPKMIEDPEDIKPDDWVDVAKIPDPEATKPDDWDEDAPPRILDESATKPEGWLDDEREMVPDPAAEKPDDWDDEEDGIWEAPLVSNPACQAAPGCGEWQRPLIANPAFKGPWRAPMIDNPEYRGVWAARQIENPAYFEDENPANVAAIAGVAVEVWTTVGGIWIDNIYIGHDVEAAKDYAEKTWRPKFALQAEKEQAASAEREAEAKAARLAAGGNGWREKAEILLDSAKEYARAQPNIAAGVATAVAVLAASLLMCMGGRRKTRRAAAPETVAGVEEHKENEPPAPATAAAAAADDADADEDGEGEEEEEDGEEEDEDEQEDEEEEEEEPEPQKRTLRKRK